MSDTAEYKTLRGPGQGSLTDRKSEFIAYARPVHSDEEAMAFVAEIRALHRDARHCVFAYLLRGGAHKRASDDGEPQGSAGKPVLDLLEKGCVEDAAIAVVRYFGGILLGTGGLVRAYSGAAQAALDDAGIRLMKKRIFLSVEASYNDWSRLERPLCEAGATVEKCEYGASVSVSLSAPDGSGERLLVLVRDLSAGRAQGKITGEGFC